MQRRAIIFLVCLFSSLTVWAGDEYPAKPGERVAQNELIVRLRQGAAAATLINGYVPGAQVQALGRERLYRVSSATGISATVSTQLAANALVDWVEPNRMRYAVATAPNDPNYPSSWWLQTVQALQAWSILPGQYLTSATAGTGRIKVAVLDTGADCTHPDFINAGGSSTNSAAGGQLMFSASQALVPTTISAPACTWQDDHGHGTHVTGIVAAATSNGVGVSGLGYPVQVIEYKVLDSQGSGFDTTIASAIMAAADAGAQVVSLSLGGAGYSQILQTAVNYAWQRNTLVVAAAGNNANSNLFFPAGANHAVGVSATDPNNNLANFSNFGNSVQLAAPGVAILSTAPTYVVSSGWNNYVSLSGTSMATPFVSALAGLVAMSTPNTTAQAILQRIEQSANSITVGGGWNQSFGFGVINASNAVSGVLRTAVNGAITGQIVNSNGNPIGGAQVTINNQTITTDTSGLYRFGTLPAGVYSVTVSAPTYPTQSLNATVAPGADTPFTVAMGVVYGKFIGAITDQGVGAAGAIVQALSNGLITAVAVADPSGNYTLWVPAGTYDLQASAIGRNTSTVSALAVSAAGTTAANITLPRMGTIAGIVRDGNLSPIANAQILVVGGSFSAGAATDGTGNYSLIGVPNGTQFSVTATAAGFLTSTQNGITVTADVNTNVSFTMLTSTVATPAFAPPGGNYSSAQSVTISTTTSGASIRYTTDGSTPTSTVGTIYSGPVSISANLTLKAIAYKTGVSDSAVAAGTYTIQTATPAFAPPGGNYSSPQSVTISTTTSGASIRYTTDGSTPTSTVGTLYSGPVSISTSLTLKAIAYKTGLADSAVASASYVITSVGSNSAVFVKADTTTQGNWKTVYGLDGYNVIDDNVSYPGYVTVTPVNALNYIWANSTPDPRAPQKALSSTDRIAATWFTSGTYTVDLNFTDGAQHQLAVYCLDWETGGGRSQTVSILDGVTNAVLDSQNVSGFQNGKYIVWKLTGHVILRVTNTGPINAAISGLFFDPAAGVSSVATPAFAPPGGNYSSPQSVTISTTTSGASIRYTTDGSTPTSTVGTLYSGPVSISTSLTLKAIAYKTGLSDSTVASASYVITSVGSNSAVFVNTDTVTQGSWKGVYGLHGYNVIDDTVSYPGYVTVTPAGSLNYIWSGSTPDPRALQKALSSTDRIAATWFTSGTYTVDLNFTDGAQHQLAVYCLDWETGGGRSQTVSILDGVTNAVLDSQNVSSFQNGKYIVWKLTGHVILRVTNTGPTNAAISGLFFDPAH